MRSIWKGSLGFGLVSIPVSLYPAEGPEHEIHFHLLDGRTMEPVRQKRVNERTGDEVPQADIVKGYEYEKDRWVVLTDDEIRSALPQSNGMIEIAQFACEDDIDPTFFARPYYLEPQPNGRKAYALLRETMRRDRRIAVGRFVLRTKQYLTAILPRGDMLVMSLLRYAHELRDAATLDLPTSELGELGITKKELDMAEQLVAAMAEPWDPAAFKDDYYSKIREIVKMKAETGEITAIEEAPSAVGGEVVDIMALLKRSLEHETPAGTARAAGAGKARRRTASGE